MPKNFSKKFAEMLVSCDELCILVTTTRKGNTMNTENMTYAEIVDQLHNLDALIRRLERETDRAAADWELHNSERQSAMRGAVNKRIRELNAAINGAYYKWEWSPQFIAEVDDIEHVKACAHYQSPEDIAEAEAEHRYELLAAFGPGETVVNILTGEKTYL